MKVGMALHTRGCW